MYNYNLLLLACILCMCTTCIFKYIVWRTNITRVPYCMIEYYMRNMYYLFQGTIYSLIQFHSFKDRESFLV